MPYKPEGYNDVSAYLLVADAEATLAFLPAAFAAAPLRITRRDDGTIRHAEVSIGDTVLMMGQTSHGTPSNVHVYLPDVDAAMARAIAAGASEVQPPTDRDSGNRLGGVTAPDGTTWWLSTEIG